MKQFVFNFTLCLCAGLISTAATPVKHPFVVCQTSSSDFNTCVGNAIESALKVLEKGYPSLGVFSVDPLRITSIGIDQGTGPISIKLQFKELDIGGLSHAKIHNFKGDVKNLVFTAEARIPRVTLTGQYTIDGKVLILPIKGQGKSQLILDDLTTDIHITGKHFKKDGKMYMKVTRYVCLIDTKKLTMHFENLFDGNKALGDNMNKFLNENSLDILKELQPAISETFGAAFGEITNRIFTKIPFNEIFP